MPKTLHDSTGLVACALFTSNLFIPIIILMIIPLALLNLLASPIAHAESACFDFTRPVNTPLKNLLQTQSHRDSSKSGKISQSGSGIWGATRGQVNLPIQTVYQKLLDHYTIKDPKKVKLRVYPQEKPGYQDFHLILVSASALIASVHWEEEWAYALTAGTPNAPKKYTISYQKTTGTRFIPHLCGSIVLTSTGPNSTDVYLYEEVDALGKRSPSDTVQGHLGTLATLRTQKNTAQF